MDKVIITCGLMGAHPGSAARPTLPEQPDEIVRQAVQCWRAGAAIVRLHARDERARATTDVGVFRHILEGIRAAGCDVIINLASGAGTAGPSAVKRIADVRELKPEIASFSVGATIVGHYDAERKTWASDSSMPISYSELETIARTILERGVLPELEVYDAGMLNNVMILREQGWLPDPLWVNFVMGIPGQVMAATPQNLLYLASRLPADALWSARICDGCVHWQMAAVAMAMGGHVRTGLEDNPYIENGVLASDNARMVEKMAQLACDIGREVASTAETREALMLDPVLDIDVWG